MWRKWSQRFSQISYKSVNKTYLIITSMAAESSDETCESRENNIERQCYVMK